jgi:hypothetical protein
MSDGIDAHRRERDALMACVSARRAPLVATNAEWAESEWSYLKRPSPTVFGSVIEQAVAEWLGAGPRTSTGNDLTLHGLKIEVKAATSRGGCVVFNQIRPGQDYSHVLLIGFLPDDVRGWLMGHADAAQASSPQHAGLDDTRMLRFNVDAPPPLAKPSSGMLHELRALLPSPETFA